MVRFLFTHNPFYLVSVALILCGLRLWTNEQTWTPSVAWQLWAALAGYTCLLATTAVLVVRAGKVWEDGRMLALLVIVMLVAISSCFDELFYKHAESVSAVLLVSAGFAVAIMETLVRALRVKLPLAYRLPLHSLMLLFFVAPIFITNPALGLSSLATGQRVLLFPIAASIITSSLVFAIHQRAASIADNGTPWRWPMYPWSIFAFLFIGVLIRSYTLTLTFHSGAGKMLLSSTFAPYYCVPLVLVVGFLMYEIGHVERLQACRLAGLVAPMLALLMCRLDIWTVTQIEFASELAREFASPVWLSIVGIGFYCMYLAWRRELSGGLGMIVCLMVLSNLPISAISLSDIRFVSPWPMAIAAAISVAYGLRFKASSWLYAANAIAALALYLTLRDMKFDSKINLLAIASHAWLFGTLILSISITDGFSNWIFRKLLPVCWLFFGVGSMATILMHLMPSMTIFAYQVMMLFIAALIGWSYREVSWQWSAILSSTLPASIVAVWSVIGLIRLELNRSTILIVGGAISFFLGAIVSLWKAGFDRFATRVAQSIIPR
jgi:hypothetical protein